MKNQKTKKNLTILVLLTLIVGTFTVLSTVQASYVCPAAQQITTALNQYTKLYAVHPSASNPSAAGMAFTANATAYLYNVEWWLWRVGAITGTLVSKLYEIQDGVVGTNAYPTSSVLAVSETVVNISDLALSGAFITFDFDGNYQIVEGNDYFIDVECTAQSGGTSSIYVSIGAAAKSSSFNIAYYQLSGWVTHTNDMGFIINGDTDAFSPTPTPTPSATPPPSVPEGFSACTFGVEPDGLVTWSYGDPENPEYVWIGHVGLTYTNPNTWQIMDGTALTVTAYPPNASYAFDHWDATTGAYNFTIPVSPLFFTVEADFTLTAVFVPIENATTYIVSFPGTAGGVIGVSYQNATEWDFSDQTYTTFLVQAGTNLTFHAVPNAGYTFSSLVVEPGDESYATQVYGSATVGVTINFDCSVYGVFTASGGNSGGADNINGVIDAILDNLNVLIYLAVIFIFGVLGYGFAGSWGFFAGINLAVIMLYIFGSLPLWVVITMIILDALMFYGKAQIGKGEKGNE